MPTDLYKRAIAFRDRGMPLREGDLTELRARIKHVDGTELTLARYRADHRLDSADPDHAARLFTHYMVGYYTAASPRFGGRSRVDVLAAEKAGDPDPDDTSHRSAIGSNSAVARAGSIPDGIDTMSLLEVKNLCNAIGGYDRGVRGEIAAQCLARLEALAPRIADAYRAAWADDLDRDSDAEAEDSTARADEESRATAALRSASARAWSEPSAAAKRRRDRDRDQDPDAAPRPATMPAAPTEAAAKAAMREASSTAYLKPSKHRRPQ